MTTQYGALAQHLQTQTDSLVTLDFAETETILGFSLPRSARTYGAWWSNTRSHAVWVPVGWASEAVDVGAPEPPAVRISTFHYTFMGASLLGVPQRMPLSTCRTIWS
ncbi:DUF7662 domain-containing protein [Xanthobacter nonsaccharivorans]|uniref:DUF7662 domain-containing protein n=1 Tax=Xanthobacter nonsaccharivorans TaxID=3119912 RepID=UPI004040C1A9